MLMGFLFLSLVYKLVHEWYPWIEKALSLPPPVDELCPSANETIDNVVKPCSRPDLLAYKVVSGIALIAIGVYGFFTWHVRKSPHCQQLQTPEGRMFGYLAEAEILSAALVTFQFWDLCMSFVIPEQGTAILMTHHVLAALCAWYALNNQVRS
jgi:hypothetical protein